MHAPEAPGSASKGLTAACVREPLAGERTPLCGSPRSSLRSWQAAGVGCISARREAAASQFVSRESFARARARRGAPESAAAASGIARARAVIYVFSTRRLGDVWVLKAGSLVTGTRERLIHLISPRFTSQRRIRAEDSPDELCTDKDTVRVQRGHHHKAAPRAPRRGRAPGSAAALKPDIGSSNSTPARGTRGQSSSRSSS